MIWGVCIIGTIQKIRYSLESEKNLYLNETPMFGWDFQGEFTRIIVSVVGW